MKLSDNAGFNRVGWKIAARYILRREVLLLLLLWPIYPILALIRRFFKRKAILPQLNAIHLISVVSILGLALGTASLVLVLSVFNGFETLLGGLFSRFKPDIEVRAVQGKYFDQDTLVLGQLKQIEGVAQVSCSIEEVAFFDYEDIQDFGTIKGVDASFARINGIDSCIVEGQYQLQEGERSLAVLGGGMRNKLSVNVENFVTPISVFMPKRGKVGPLEQPFVQQFLFPSGTFIIQQEFDDKYILTNLAFVQDLLYAPDKLSSIEIGLHHGANMRATALKVSKLLGPAFKVQDRLQQDAAFIKLLNIERWLSFSFLVLTVVLVVFNLIGCLWMIVLDKKPDISTLKALGATDASIFGLVLRVGALLSAVGLFLGFAIALLLYGYHKTYGLFDIPQGFVVNSYPAELRGTDFLIVALLVLSMGILATWPAARKARSFPTLFRSA